MQKLFGALTSRLNLVICPRSGDESITFDTISVLQFVIGMAVHRTSSEDTYDFFVVMMVEQMLDGVITVLDVAVLAVDECDV